MQEDNVLIGSFYLKYFLLKKNILNISHKLLRSAQFLEKFMEILEWSACRNKSGPSPLLNVAVYWQHPSLCLETVSDTYKQHYIGNTQVCAKMLSQILANYIDNGGRGIGLRIYVRYCWYLVSIYSSSKELFKSLLFKNTCR